MRVGLHGGMANNMYCLTKVLRKRGVQADYLHDLSDNFAMSQPVWEDAELRLPPAATGAQRQALDWRALEMSVAWEKPSWMVTSDSRPSHRLRVDTLSRAAVSALAELSGQRAGLGQRFRVYARYVVDHASLIEAMSQYDWLIICGTGAIAASLCGVPYVYWPHGGDIRVVPFSSDSPSERRL